MSDVEVVIVGAGLAGLACARVLQEQGVTCQVLEASDDVGGRARTDVVDGFLLDRGFQVVLTAYPELRRVFDLPKLELHPFEPGALVHFRDRFHRVADPMRRPIAGVSSLFTPIGRPWDWWSLFRIKSRLRRSSMEQIFQLPEYTTRAYLQAHGCSELIIERFFRPWFGGVFLESKLETSSLFFEFIFKMFAEGDVCLPSRGIGALANQLAGKLASGVVRTNSMVLAVEGTTVQLAGESLHARAVVIATDGENARSLAPDDSPPLHWRGVTCIYFVAERSPIGEPILVLNGDSQGPVNNLAVLSDVAPSYAPPGASLISVSVLGTPGESNELLIRSVLDQLTAWFGQQVRNWRCVRVERIPHGLPDQSVPSGLSLVPDVRLTESVLRCGDWTHSASVQGALESGRHAAEAVLRALQS